MAANSKSVGAAFSDMLQTAVYVNPPATKTASFTLDDDVSMVITNGSAGAVTITLPDASKSIGRVLTVKNLSASYTTIASATLVKPQTTDSAGTAILAATAGKYARMVCDGTYWIIMESN